MELVNIYKTPLYISTWDIVNSLEQHLLNQIKGVAYVNDIVLNNDKLYKNGDDYFNSGLTEFLTDDKKLITLYKTIKLLEQYCYQSSKK